MKRLREQFRGLYWRQMSITVGMVLLTLVLLGTVFFSLSYNYARGQKTDELLERAQVVSRLSDIWKAAATSPWRSYGRIRFSSSLPPRRP